MSCREKPQGCCKQNSDWELNRKKNSVSSTAIISMGKRIRKIYRGRGKFCKLKCESTHWIQCLNVYIVIKRSLYMHTCSIFNSGEILAKIAHLTLKNSWGCFCFVFWVRDSNALVDICTHDFIYSRSPCPLEMHTEMIAVICFKTVWVAGGDD